MAKLMVELEARIRRNQKAYVGKLQNTGEKNSIIGESFDPPNFDISA